MPELEGWRTAGRYGDGKRDFFSMLQHNRHLNRCVLHLYLQTPSAYRGALCGLLLALAVYTRMGMLGVLTPSFVRWRGKTVPLESHERPESCG
jgi:hypothetical protein